MNKKILTPLDDLLTKERRFTFIFYLFRKHNIRYVLNNIFPPLVNWWYRKKIKIIKFFDKIHMNLSSNTTENKALDVAS